MNRRIHFLFFLFRNGTHLAVLKRVLFLFFLAFHRMGNINNPRWIQAHSGLSLSSYFSLLSVIR